MFRLTGSFIKLKVDRNRFTQAITDTIDKLVHEAMREFLEAAVEHIPVFSGMARGSLRPIAQSYGVGARIPIEELIDPRAKEYKGHDVAAGEKLGKNFEFIANGRHIYCTFQPEVEHYLRSEFTEMDPWFPYRKGNEPPWESFEAGRKAYIAYMRQHLKARVPKVRDFISRTRVTILDQAVKEAVEEARG